MIRRLLILLYSIFYACLIIVGLIPFLLTFLLLVFLSPIAWVITGIDQRPNIGKIMVWFVKILNKPFCTLGEHEYPQFVFEYPEDELNRKYTECICCGHKKYIT